MTHVVNSIVDKMVEKLLLVMQTNIDEDEITYADIVKKGLVQENRAKKNVSIGVTPGDHDDPSYIDGILTLDKMPSIGVNYPVREFGGGQYWWRRGTVRIECFFIREKLEEPDAFIAAYEVLGRLMDNIETVDLSTVGPDSFGERPLNPIYCYGNTFFESGGAPKSFIFRGKVFWQCMTERK